MSELLKKSGLLLLLIKLSFIGFSQEKDDLGEAYEYIESKKYIKAKNIFIEYIKKNDSLSFLGYFGMANVSVLSDSNYALGLSYIDSILIGVKERNFNNQDFIIGSCYLMKSSVALLADETDDIIKYSKKTLKYNIGLKNRSVALNNLGYYSIALGKYKSALKYYNESINIDGSTAHLYNNRALCYIKLNQFSKAKLDLDRSRRMTESNPYLFKHYALYYLGLGENEKACEMLSYAESRNYSEYLGGVLEDKNEVKELQEKHCQSDK